MLLASTKNWGDTKQSPNAKSNRRLEFPSSNPLKALATLYTEGDAAHRLPRHRLPVFNDYRGRAQQRFDILEKYLGCVLAILCSLVTSALKSCIIMSLFKYINDLRINSVCSGDS